MSSAGQWLVFDSSDLSIETIELFCIYVFHCFWIDVAVRICPRICFCRVSISKNAFRRFESVYRPQKPEMHLQNSKKLQSRKLLVKYSAFAECEIIHFVNCEILLPQVAMWNEICPHSRSEYFTRRRRISHFAEIFHLPARANFVEKSTCLGKCFFLCVVT